MDLKRSLLALAALAAGLAVAWLMLSNDVRDISPSDVVLVLGVGWSFVASGLVAWQLRPGNPIGPVMIGAGFLRFAAAVGWSQDPLLFSIGRSLTSVYLVALGYVLLAFPLGRLTSRLERTIFAALAVAGGPLHVVWLMAGAPPCAGCPRYLFQVADGGGAATIIGVVHGVIAILAGVSTLVLLALRWRRASASLRFAIGPLLWAGVGAWVAALFWMATSLLGVPLGAAPKRASELTLTLIAVAFLVGVARTRLARAAVADLVVELRDSPGADTLQTALGRVLHDPTLRVAYWLGDQERFVDAGGSPVDVMAENGRAVTMIERDGRRIAALLHDPAALQEEQLIGPVRAAAALHLDNERLQAELRAQLGEVAASRSRILEAEQRERRRIERDLHDGTQQRLVSVAMTLGLADSKLAAQPTAAATLLQDAKRQLSDALQELRDLSQGIHPGILTERGLAPALAELTDRIDLPIALDVSLQDRLPDRVEEAAYYVVSEALTNVVKHAHATRVNIEVGRRDGLAEIRVADDGVGGADVAGGSGLRGLTDRVEAFGGRLRVASPRGGGTLLEARIPCVS